MKRTFLKTTVAALALTAGSAFAQDTNTNVDAAAEAEATVTSENVENTGKELGETLKKRAQDTAQDMRDGATDTAKEVTDAVREATGNENVAKGLQTETEVEGDADVADTEVETETETESDLAEGEVESETTLEAEVEDDVEVEGDTDLATDDDAEIEGEMSAESETEIESDTDLAEGVASDTETNLETDVTRTDTSMSNAFSGMVVGDLIGLKVVEADGESIGEVDSVIKTEDGYAAVVGVGGFLGLGERTVAVPLDEISMAAENDLKLSTWTKAELEAQPEIDEDTVENLEDDVRLDEAS